MRLSSSFAAPSAVAILSIALLCGPSGTAVSQTATGSAAPLPSITVEVPKRVARPQQVATPHRPKQVANTVASRRTSPAAQTPLALAAAAPDSVLGRLAKLEKASSSCNGGCETSFKSGNAPWIGCSFSGGENSTFSPTCTDTLTYKTYVECLDTKQIFGRSAKKSPVDLQQPALRGEVGRGEASGRRTQAIRTSLFHSGLPRGPDIRQSLSACRKCANS
jgi:hypothetical protein